MLPAGRKDASIIAAARAPRTPSALSDSARRYRVPRSSPRARVALLTPHHAYDLAWLSQHATMVFDARNAFAGRRVANVVTL